MWPPFSQLKQLLAIEISGASGLAFVAVELSPVLPGILSAVPPFLPEVVSFLVGLILVGRLSPSDSPLLLMILVLVDIL